MAIFKFRKKSASKNQKESDPSTKSNTKDDKAARRKKRWKKILKYGAITLGALAVAGLITYIVIAATLPADLNNLKIAEATQILARNGDLLYNIHGEENRVVMPYDQIPEDIKKATVAVEDRNFYKHWGFSMRGILRAAFFNIKSDKTLQGGSTITQQFVKNALLTSERTFTRKIKELVLAVEIERRYSKDEILGFYLNQIPYGSNAYGVKSAAKTFFNKDPKDLTLTESAYLAALPQAPTYYSPFGNHRTALDARKDKVLDSMQTVGYLDAAAVEKAKVEKVEFKLTPQNITAPHFVFYVREQLVKKYGEDFVETGGLKVYTTLDPEKQRIAEEAVKKGASANEGRFQVKNAALVAVEPYSGEVVAMVGSRDYFNMENDGNVNITTSLQQPGSSFKPYEYVTAFDKGYTPDTILFDLVTDFGNNYKPGNYSKRTQGPVTMRKALANSLNIPAVKTLYLAGQDNTINTAEKLGITSLKDRSRFGLSMALGAAEVTPLEHTAAYAVFGNDGVKHETRAILKIEDHQGKLVDEFKADNGERVIGEEAVRMLNNVLADNGARDFGSLSNNLVIPGKPAAAKTGTTQDFRDAWTMGYTPLLAAGVWVGNNDNTPMVAGADGLYVAAPIYNDFMTKALANADAKDFIGYKKPDTDKPVLNNKLAEPETVTINKYSGKIATGSCPAGLTEQKTYRSVHEILFYVDKDNPRGPVPADPQKDPQFNNWEAPVRSWAGGGGYSTDSPPRESEDCQQFLAGKVPTIGISRPGDGSTVTALPISISALADSFFGVTKVEFYFDGTLMATASGPFSASLKPKAANGYHAIKAVAYDGIGQNVSASIKINLQVSDSAPKVNLTKPGSPVTLDRGADFPYTLSATATDDVGIKSVRFYYDGNLIGTDTTPSGSSYSVSWSTPPGPGTVDVWAVAEDTASQTTQSTKVKVTLI